MRQLLDSVYCAHHYIDIYRPHQLLLQSTTFPNMVPCTTTTLVKTRYSLSALYFKRKYFFKLNKETLTIYLCEAPHIDFMSFARVEGSFILISFSPLDYFITGFVGVCVIIFIFPSCCIFFFWVAFSLSSVCGHLWMMDGLCFVCHVYIYCCDSFSL